jgi:hypothetical protein
MNQDTIAVGYTIPCGLDWEERGEPVPLSIKYGDCVCVIERENPNALLLAKGSISANTGRYVKNDIPIVLPEGFQGRFCVFCELGGDTLCVFVMADDLQTCALYGWDTTDCYGYGQLPEPLPANAHLDRVVILDETNIELTYYIDQVAYTITVQL